MIPMVTNFDILNHRNFYSSTSINKYEWITEYKPEESKDEVRDLYIEELTFTHTNSETLINDVIGNLYF